MVCGLFFCEQIPVSSQGAIKEKLDAMILDLKRSPCDRFFLVEINQVLPELIFCDPVGRDRKILCELPDSPDVFFLGAGTESRQIHVIDHAFAQFAHSGILFF